MARRSVQVEVMAFTLLALIVTAMAQGGCPSLTSYTPCLNYVRNDNRIPGRNDPCCVLIRTTSEACLCAMATNNAASAVGLNLQKALTLPKACGRTVPPNTYCGSIQVPN